MALPNPPPPPVTIATRSLSSPGTDLERGCAGLRDCMVLISRTAAYANRAHDLPNLFQRNPARKDHDFAVIRCMNAEKLAAGLRVLCQVLGCDVERARSVSFFDRNIDAAEPCAVHRVDLDGRR